MTSSALFRQLVLFASVVLLSACASQPPPKVNVFNNLDLQVASVPDKTPLMQAAEAGSAVGVKRALEQGVLLNAVTDNDTAFSLALRSGHVGLSQFLLAAGADWWLGFKEGDVSALMLAAESAMNDLVKALLIKGVPINYTDSEGHSALSKASLRGHLTTVKILIGAGADPNAMSQGDSLLMKVVEDNNMLISQLLIEAGADVNYRNDEGVTALQVARRNGFFDLDLMLVQSGARP